MRKKNESKEKRNLEKPGKQFLNKTKSEESYKV